MSWGLMVYSEEGEVELDISTRLQRIHSTHTVTINYDQWETISVPGITDDGSWIVFVFTELVVVEILNGSVRVRAENVEGFINSTVSITIHIYRC